MLIDVHVHSHHSPGCTLAPHDIVRRAKEAGLDGVVVTDLTEQKNQQEMRLAKDVAEKSNRAKDIFERNGAEDISSAGEKAA